MKLEYTVLIVALAVAAPSFAALGAGMEHAIARDTDSRQSGAPSDAPTGEATRTQLPLPAPLAAQAGIASGVAHAAGRAPEAVLAGFLEESRALAAAAGIDEAATSERLAQGLIALEHWPRLMADFLNAAEAPVGGPTRFGVPEDTLPVALRLWATVSDPDAPHFAIRGAMEGNLALLDEALTSRGERVIKLMEQAGPLDELIDARSRVETARGALARTRAKRKLSKTEALRVTETAFRAFRDRGGDSWLARAGGLFPRAGRMGDADIFPLVAHGNGYWGYERVLDMIENEVVVAELPVHGKSFDGGWGQPHAYAAHDYNHASYMMRGLYDDSGYGSTLHHSRVVRELVAKGRALRAADPELGLAVEKALGVMLWEHTSLRELLDEGSFASKEAIETLARWTQDLGKRLGDDLLLDEAADVLGR